MKIKRLKKRQKFILFLLVCLIIIVIFLFFYINKLSQKEVNNTTTTPPTGPTTPPTGPTTPPTGPTTPPTGPTTPPTGPTTLSKWEIVLNEINTFINSDLQNLQEIKNWINQKNCNPLEGINLAGVGDDLKKIRDCGPIENIKNDPNCFYYKDWVQLPVAGDGNCFLHSFSVFLLGKSDIELTLKLRIAICLELMTNPDKYFDSNNEKKKIESIKKEIKKERIAENKQWLNSDITKYLAHVLKRPIFSITKKENNNPPFQVYKYPNSNTGEGNDFVLQYLEPWVIYNDGGIHFQPLIKK